MIKEVNISHTEICSKDIIIKSFKKNDVQYSKLSNNDTIELQTNDLLDSLIAYALKLP